MFKRIALLLATNLAVMVLLGIVLSVLQGVFGITLGNNGTLLVFAAVFGFGGAFISLGISKWMAKRSTGMQLITQPRNEAEAWLHATVRRQAEAAGIKMPEVGIFDAPEINAFATGPSRNNIDSWISGNREGGGIAYYAIVFVLDMVFGALASIIAMWFSRWREFRADAGGADLAGREKMIAALQKLASTYGQSTLPTQVRAFGISGSVGGGFKRLFMSHPPLAERIQALRDAPAQPATVRG